MKELLVALPEEAATVHSRRTGHYLYEGSLARDVEVLEYIYGRLVRETDPVIGVLICAACSRIVWNR